MSEQLIPKPKNADDVIAIEGVIGAASELQDARNIPARRLQATLRMWDAGYSFEDIAEKLEYVSGRDVRLAVEAALASSESITMNRDDLRKSADRVLMQYHAIAYEHITAEEPYDQGAWIKLATSLLDRHIRLLGLDAPQIHLINPDSSEIERYASLLAIAAGGSSVDEADPFS